MHSYKQIRHQKMNIQSCLTGRKTKLSTYSLHICSLFPLSRSQEMENGNPKLISHHFLLYLKNYIQGC
jgi:hypothetical protein